MILAGAPLCAGAETAAPDDSPFAPAAGAGTEPGAAPEAFELAGASATGQGTEICLYNTRTKHSTWIAVGASGDGVQILSFDPDRDQAVVTMRGERKILSLRKAVVTPEPAITFAAYASAVSPAAAQAAPVNVALSSSAPAGQEQPTDPKTAELNRQAREARMFVSDLMEIGMAQRKAYAEAKQKAALQGEAVSQ
jgi:hypothetical protein